MRGSSSPRVLRLITRLNIGGPARQALILSRELHREFPTTLAAGRPPSAEGELFDPLVPVRRVPLVRPLHPATDARAVRAVRSLMREAPPALVHTHMAKAGAVGRVAALTMRPRPRTVHTFHGHVLAGYFQPMAQRSFIEIERRLAGCTDLLIAVSDEIRDSLLDLGIGRPEQFHVVPLGLDLTSLLEVQEPSGTFRNSLGLGADVPLIGVVGRLVPVKENDTLVQAAARVPGAHLALVGDGESRRNLETRARELGIGHRVHFTGWRSDVTAVFSDLDVVALSSRNEGTPVSLIEAAACARPVVATAVGGVPAVVKHDLTGYLTSPGDVDAMATRLRELLSDSALRRRMGEAGRNHVEVSFGKDRLVEDIRDVYTALCDAPRGRSSFQVFRSSSRAPGGAAVRQ